MGAEVAQIQAGVLVGCVSVSQPDRESGIAQDFVAS